MDERRFDAMARGIGRRGVLRAAMAAAGLGAFAASGTAALAGPSTEGFCEEKAKGVRCRRNGQCCSGRCKKKKGKRKGTCTCSPLQARCSSQDDCCPPAAVNAVSPACFFRIGASERTCCMGEEGHCAEDEDCCGISQCVDVTGVLRCREMP